MGIEKLDEKSSEGELARTDSWSEGEQRQVLHGRQRQAHRDGYGGQPQHVRPVDPTPGPLIGHTGFKERVGAQAHVQQQAGGRVA